MIAPPVHCLNLFTTIALLSFIWLVQFNLNPNHARQKNISRFYPCTHDIATVCTLCTIACVRGAGRHRGVFIQIFWPVGGATAKWHLHVLHLSCFHLKYFMVEPLLQCQRLGSLVVAFFSLIVLRICHIVTIFLFKYKIPWSKYSVRTTVQWFSDCKIPQQLLLPFFC